MFKERTTDFDWGEDYGENHNYYASSIALGSMSNVINLGWDTFQGLSEKRNYGKERATAPFTGNPLLTGGIEEFYSTNSKPPHFNNCQHKKTGGINHPWTTCYKNRAGAPYGAWFWRWNTNNATPVTQLDRHYNVDLSTAQRTAWGTMQPRFEGDISMFNFIVELKDFRSLARFLLNKPLRKLSNMVKRWRRKPSFDPTKPLAELHLANEFALKPLISDIVQVTVQIEELVSDVQQKFADAGRVRNTRHYTEHFQVSENDTRTAYYQSKAPYQMVGQSEQLTFTATMEYSYEYNMSSTLDAFVKYWGLAPDQESIWNAIPGSFLVDYFLKVGKALGINSRDKNVILNTTQYCESLLSERTNGIHFNGAYLIGPLLLGASTRSGSGNYLVAGHQSSFYTRRLTRPKTGPVMPRLHIPSSKQGWNMAALLRCFF